jgi:hypothetical protein
MKTTDIIFPRSTVFNRRIDDIKQKVAKMLDAGEYKKVKIKPAQLNMFASQMSPSKYKDKICFTHPSKGTSSVEFPDFQKYPVVAKIRDKYLIIDGHHRTTACAYDDGKMTVYLVNLPADS